MSNVAQNKQSTMDELHAKLASLAEQAKVIENVADAEKRSMTDEEVKSIASITDAFETVEREIEARGRTGKMDAKVSEPGQRVTKPADLGAPVAATSPRVEGGMPSGATRGSWGFRSIGEWALAARKTANGHADNRIMNAPASYGSEGTNADGGYAVPPDFREAIMKIVQGEESLLSRTDQQVTTSNGITLPLDSATPWATSGGVLGGWVAEGAAITPTKPALGTLTVKAQKLAALVPLTDELLEDVPAMTRYLTSKVPEKFNSLINTAIVSGSGSGQPQGLMNAACLVTQAAESGQGAGTVVAKNILKMFGRLYGGCRKNAVWLINQDVEQQLQQLVIGSSPTIAAYLPPGGLSGAPYATLLGRPVIPVEACSAVGTAGDIILVDLSQYLTVMKAGGVKTDTSIHLYFDSDHTAFRFVMRLGGQSYWPGTLTRQNGSNTLSHVVCLNSTRT